MHWLDNPFWHAARRTWAPAACVDGSAILVRCDTQTLAALPDGPSSERWDDLRKLLHPGASATLAHVGTTEIPSSWAVQRVVPAFQLVAGPGVGRHSSAAVQLRPSDVAAMSELSRLAGEDALPTPWLDPASMARGDFVGLRDQDQLVAMAGTRLRGPGWMEISSVCVHPDARRAGFATTLVRELAYRFERVGCLPFLYTTNDYAATAFFRQVGFVRRAETAFVTVRAPGRERRERPTGTVTASAGSRSQNNRPPLPVCKLGGHAA